MEAEEPAGGESEEDAEPRPALNGGQHRTAGPRLESPVAPAPERDEAHEVLEDAERAQHGTVDAPDEQRGHEEEHEHQGRTGEQGRHELDLPQPREPAGDGAGEVKERGREREQHENAQHEAQDGQETEDVLTHGHSS